MKWERERERKREGMREQGFMCSLVNERQALKVTGCVYYWSVSRLMGRGEEKREEQAKLLSRDQSTQAWEPERAPSNKLCHTRSICPYRRILLHTEFHSPATKIKYLKMSNFCIIAMKLVFFQWTNISRNYVLWSTVNMLYFQKLKLCFSHSRGLRSLSQCNLKFMTFRDHVMAASFILVQTT